MCAYSRLDDIRLQPLFLSPARLEAIAIGREKPARIHKGRGVKQMVKCQETAR